MTARPADRDPAAGSRYEVTVGGGKGSVIGDYATVVQVFRDAPAPLASLIRTREFTALIEERTREFVGRDFVFAAVREAIEDAAFPSGYLMLQGEPGIGKTAIISRLVTDHGWVHHFNVAPLGLRSPRAFLANVCAQLIVRYNLGHTSLPPEATRDGGFLVRLLTEAADDPRNLPIVVAVDALDEAEESSSGANRLFLPPDLPEGAFVIVTGREESDPGLYVTSRRDIYLRDDDPRNIEDVHTYIRAFTDAHAAAMRRRIQEWHISEAEFVRVLTDRSAGNFMYIVHVLRDIASGALSDVRSLPQGLKEYYRRHWNAMRAVDREYFRRYQEPVVCLLATALEPVTAVDLLEWTGTHWRRQGWATAELSAAAVKEVLDAWREFLNEDRTGGDAHYRIYHASFQDFLAAEVGLTGYHAAIGATAAAKIPGLSGSG